MTTYDRPIEATLHVHLASGETWEATPTDLAKFGLVKRLDAYIAFQTKLAARLLDADLIEREKDLTNAALNPLRYLVETAVCYPHLLNHPDHNDWVVIVDIERKLRLMNDIVAYVEEHQNDAHELVDDEELATLLDRALNERPITEDPPA